MFKFIKSVHICKYRMVAFKSVAQGSSHLKYEPPVPCQDYADVYECKTPNYGVAAVADGHGSAKHIRSEKGSRFAVEVALAAVKDFMDPKSMGKHGIQEIQKMSPEAEDIDKKLRHIKEHIVHKWRECVKKDFERDGLSEREKEICEKEKLDMGKEEWEVALYGATLLFAILIPAYKQPGVLAFQIGDGGCVLIYENGEPRFLEELFDDVQEGGRTNSICASNAAEKFRHIWLPGKFKGITVASDGVTDSFDRSNGSYLKFNKTLFENFEKSPADTVQEELDNYLPKLSGQGSGDDMSIAGIFMLDDKAEKEGSE